MCGDRAGTRRLLVLLLLIGPAVVMVGMTDLRTAQAFQPSPGTTVAEQAAKAATTVLPKAGRVASAVPCAGWLCVVKPAIFAIQLASTVGGTLYEWADQACNGCLSPTNYYTGPGGSTYVPPTATADPVITVRPSTAQKDFGWVNLAPLGVPVTLDSAVSTSNGRVPDVLYQHRPIPEPTYPVRVNMRYTLTMWAKGYEAPMTHTQDVLINTTSTAGPCGEPYPNICVSTAPLGNGPVNTATNVSGMSQISTTVWITAIKVQPLTCKTGQFYANDAVPCSKDVVLRAAFAPPTAAQLATATAPAPPKIEYQARVRCRKADGSFQWITGAIRTADADGVARAFAPSCPEVLPGSYADRQVIERIITAPGTPPVVEPVHDDQIAPAFREAYPGCFGTTCTKDWEVDGTPCTVGDPRCTPEEFTRRRSLPTPGMVCRWGVYALALDDCLEQDRAYVPAPTTTPSPGPSPASSPAPGTEPSSAPSPATTYPPVPLGTGTTTVTNPDGSTTSETSRVNPDGSTSTTTRVTNPDGTIRSETTTTTNMPLSGVNSGGQGQGQPGGEGCLSSTWSWNPVSWIYAPVKCALQWAFVPPQAKVDQLLSTKDQLSTRVPFGYVGQASNVLGAASSDAAGPCNEGPTATINGYVFKPLNLCTGPLGEALPTTRPLLTVVMWLGILVPFGMWLFRQSVPVIGGGEQA